MSKIITVIGFDCNNQNHMEALASIWGSFVGLRGREFTPDVLYEHVRMYMPRDLADVGGYYQPSFVYSPPNRDGHNEGWSTGRSPSPAWGRS